MYSILGVRTTNNIVVPGPLGVWIQNLKKDTKINFQSAAKIESCVLLSVFTGIHAMYANVPGIYTTSTTKTLSTFATDWDGREMMTPPLRSQRTAPSGRGIPGSPQA